MGVSGGRARGAPLAWLTWAVLGGLVLVFAGERIVPGVTPFRIALSGGGALLLLVATLARAAAWRRASAGSSRALPASMPQRRQRTPREGWLNAAAASAGTSA